MMPDATDLPIVNRQFRLAARPFGVPTEANFVLVDAPLDAPGDGQVLAKAIFLSVDPYIRRAISGDKSYSEGIDIGSLIPGLAVAQVVVSHNSGYTTGQYVLGEWGWQEYSVSDGKAWIKLDSNASALSAKLGVFGLPGLTAYFGLLDICQPKPGETVVVSGAAGAVGSLAGQIAKISGCRTVGIAGSDRKVAWLLSEAGLDGAFNHKTMSAPAKLRELCSSGIDCYFDNVGGTITEAVISHMNPFGRVAVCGLISQYNNEGSGLSAGSSPFEFILRKQLRVEGFLFTRFQTVWREGLTQLAQWVGDGKLKPRETTINGFTNTPRAFIGLMRGDNIGKMLVRL